MKIEDMNRQINQLNIKEKDISKWDKDELKRLSNGYMTKSLKTIEIDGKKLKVKLSFEDGKLKIHPKKKEISEKHGFTKDQLAKLKSGETVFKNRRVYQLDKDINEVVSMKSSQLANKLPNQYNGKDLTKENKRDISVGKPIDRAGTTTEILMNLVISDPVLLLGLQMGMKAAGLLKDSTAQVKGLNPLKKDSKTMSVQKDTLTFTQSNAEKKNSIKSNSYDNKNKKNEQKTNKPRRSRS